MHARVKSVVAVALALIPAGACGPRQVAPGGNGGAAGTGAAVGAAAPDAGPPAPDAPLPLERDMPTLARRSADMLVALGDALASDADCEALADAASAVFTEYREVRVAAALAEDQGRGAALDAALDAHADRIAAAATRMQPTLTRCSHDAEFVDAMTPFDVP